MERAEGFNPGKWALGIVATVIALFITIPTLVVFPLSINNSQFLAFPPKGFTWKWYSQFFSQSAWLDPLWHTLLVATVSALLAALVGTLAAVGFVRGKFFGQGLLRGALLVPMVMPTMVLGIGLYRFYANLHLVGTLLGLILCYGTLGLPMVLLAVSAGLQRIDERLEMAARSLGCGPVKAFIKVTLPFLWPSIITGALFAFIIAFDEVVIASFLSGTSAVTLPLQMWLGLKFQVNPVVPAASAVNLVAAGLLFFLITRVGRRDRQLQAGGMKG